MYSYIIKYDLGGPRQVYATTETEALDVAEALALMFRNVRVTRFSGVIVKEY